MSEEKKLDSFEFDNEKLDSVSGGVKARSVTFQCNKCKEMINSQEDASTAKCRRCDTKYVIDMIKHTLWEADDNYKSIGKGVNIWAWHEK